MKLLGKILIVLIVLCVIAAAALRLAAADPRLMSAALRWAASRYCKSVQVQDITIASLKYAFPSSWVLSDVRVRLVLNAQVLEIRAAGADFRDLRQLLIIGEKAAVDLKGVSVLYGKLNAGPCALRAVVTRSSSGISAEGVVSVVEISWDQWKARAVSAVWAGDTASLVLHEGLADVYGGKLSVVGKVMFRDSLEYEAAVSLKGGDAVELERALGRDAREFSGRLSGYGKVHGLGDRIDVLDAALDMPAGGEVSAAFLSLISSYLPSSAQKKKLDALIDSGGRLAVEVFSFTIKNDAPDRLSGKIGLKSREANIELNIAHEIRVDARVDSLLRTWQLFMDSWQKVPKPVKGS